jgi:hypothetical protein
MSNSPYILNQKLTSLRSLLNNSRQQHDDLEEPKPHIASGYIGKEILLQSVYAVVEKNDGEGHTYHHGQQFTSFKPIFPESWGLTLRNLHVSPTTNNYLALEIQSTINNGTCSYIRRELLSNTDQTVRISDADVICLHSQKFKKNSSLIVKIEGCRPFKNHTFDLYGKTCLLIRVWGIGIDDKQLYNEITATFDDDSNNHTSTNYITTVFTTNPFASLGTAWEYPDGFF